MILFGESSLHRATREFVEHYHFERPHQGLSNEVIERTSPRPTSWTEVWCEERLGGIPKHYRRAAQRWDTTGRDAGATGFRLGERRLYGKGKSTRISA